MSDFMLFVMQHWFLWSLAILIFAAIIFLETRNTVSGVTKISVQQLINLINHENAVVVDIRSPETFKEGHIIDAVNIPQTDFEQNLKKLQKHRNKPISIVCDQGIASIKVGANLRTLGFEKVYSLDGGIKAW